MVFKGNKTIVSGESATGKTLICTLLNGFIKDKNQVLKPYNADNIFLLTEDNKEKFINRTDKLIIIDRAEYILDNEMVAFINNDKQNRYLIFLRKAIGIELSPNHFAELKSQNNETILEYVFDVEGWY